MESLSVPLDVPVSELVDKIQWILSLEGDLPESVKIRISSLARRAAREG